MKHFFQTQSFVVLLSSQLVFLASCSFNKIFLHPDKLPAQLQTVTITRKITGDTVLLHIGPNFQPSFTDKSGNALPAKFNIQSTVFRSSSGNKLCSWYLKPINPSTGISLLFLHGNSGNILSEYSSAVAFAERGFNVFIFDYSGFGFSEGKATRDNVLKDAQAALDYVFQKTNADHTQLIIYGQSLGGHAAQVLAARNQDKISGIVSEGAFSSHKDIAASRSRPFGFAARVLVTEKYSALKSVKGMHKPVLIIHSAEDKTIPYRLGQKLFAHANAPKSFYTIAHDHIEGPIYYADSIASRIIRLRDMN